MQCRIPLRWEVGEEMRGEEEMRCVCVCALMMMLAAYLCEELGEEIQQDALDILVAQPHVIRGDQDGLRHAPERHVLAWPLEAES